MNTYDNPWIYKSLPFDSTMIGGAFGFVYLITNKITGKLYVGKKFFTKAGYKTIKGKRKKLRLESDWMNYYSSSDELNEDVKKHGKESFSREILKICHSKAELNYYELKEQMSRDVLLYPDRYYNAYVGTRIHRNHMIKKKKTSSSNNSSLL